MNKDTKEGVRLPSKLVDSIYQSTEDGKFNPFKDFTNFIDDFIAIQPAIDGFNNIKDENISMTTSERDEVETEIYDNMPNVPEDDRYDLTKGMSGILGFLRFSWRKGFERGREKLVSELKAGKVKIEDL